MVGLIGGDGDRVRNFYYNILNIVSHSVLSCYETFEF